MNRMELVAAIAEKSELSKKDAEKALKAFTDVVAEELKKGEQIQLVGFGTSRYPRELQEREEIRRLARPCRLRLPRLRSSQPERH